VFFVFWQSPDFSELFSMFTIMATYYHEMCHGLVALAVGMEFSHVYIASDGNGYAQIYFYETKDKFRDQVLNSLVSFAGPLGGPLIGGILLFLSAHSKETLKRTNAIFGMMILFSSIIWVRGKDIGFLFIYILGIALLYISIRFPPYAQRAVIRFLGIHACMAVFTEMDYLFSRTVREFEEKTEYLDETEKFLRKKVLKKDQQLTDTGEIQKLLGVPYDNVALAVMAISLLVMAASLYYIHYREKQRKKQTLLP
jgi:hypothetical protein